MLGFLFKPGNDRDETPLILYFSSRPGGKKLFLYEIRDDSVSFSSLEPLSPPPRCLLRKQRDVWALALRGSDAAFAPMARPSGRPRQRIRGFRNAADRNC